MQNLINIESYHKYIINHLVEMEWREKSEHPALPTYIDSIEKFLARNIKSFVRGYALVIPF